MHTLAFVTLAVSGFVACAEFGSYAFVHPVLRRLPTIERITVEQGLLKTFGRVMPVGMMACLVLAIVLASTNGDSRPWSWAAVAAFATSLVFTLVVNVPINLATGRWDPQHPPTGWEHHRSRWETGQGVRSWMATPGRIPAGMCGSHALNGAPVTNP